jgi:hypothetical protein
MYPVFIAAALLLGIVGNPVTPTDSECLLIALVERAELTTAFGPTHPTRVKCEETIHKLQNVGVKIAPDQLNRELQRALRSREDMYTTLGLSHPKSLKLHARIAILATLLQQSPSSSVRGGDASPAVKIEITGKLEAYRHLLFGHAAVGIKVDNCRYWLDYSSNLKELEGKLTLPSAIVTGTLEFRDIGLPAEKEDVVVGKRQAVIVVKSIMPSK